MSVVDAKEKGAYYTPTKVASTLVRWVIRKPTDRLLDPSCGDGEFLSLHRNSAGVEQDPTAVAAAASRTTARIYVGDFFDWAERGRERFDCAAGNPPFIRYQRFNGPVRDRALSLCRKLGVRFTALTSSWAPFLVGTSSLLKPGGRMAFVVPAEIGHANYSAPLLEYLTRSFSHVQLVAIRDSVFKELSQDIWLLYTEGYGGKTDHIGLSTFASFRALAKPPRPLITIPLSTWQRWRCRLRPFVLPIAVRELYEELRQQPGSFQLGDVARINIGYVTGANDFFHLRPSVADASSIPNQFLVPSVRNSRVLPRASVDHRTVEGWIKQDHPCLLLRVMPNDFLPAALRRYLNSEEGEAARTSYKCRNRSPWYSVPDVVIPDGFLAYMSNSGPALVANGANCVCTNSVHTVRMTNGRKLAELQRAWTHPLTVLSTELEGHPLGGGMLKLEPREASRILICGHERKLSGRECTTLQLGTSIMRAWRHYA